MGLPTPGPTRDGDGDIIDFNVRPEWGKVAKPALAAALTSIGLGGVAFAGYLGVEHVFKVAVPENLAADAVEAALRRLPGVAYAEPNLIGEVHGTTPNDPNFGSQDWHPIIDTQGTTGAWDYSSGSSSVVVAVLDSGVNYNHFDLAPNRWQNPWETAGDGIDNDGNGKTDDYFGYDFVGNGTTPDTIPLDVFGHGTPVAWVIAAAGNNSTGVAGTSWNSKILPVRILNASGSGTLDWVIQGIQYVNGLRDLGVNVRVINGSFGFTALDSTGISSLSAAITDAGNREIMYVASAGNSNVDIDAAGNHSYPADLSNANIITVASTTDTDTKADFSNSGKTSVDLAAPGEFIYTTTYNPGSNNSYGDTTLFGSDPIPRPISGTSFSAPMVAGVAALAFSINPAASVAYVKDAILDNVDVIPALNDPNGDGNNFDRYVATGGRLNALNAIQAVSQDQGFTRITDTTKTQIGRWDSSVNDYVPLATLSNSSSQKVAIYGLAGNDYIYVGPNVNNPVYFHGGGGADTLKGNATADTLIGEAGNDMEGGSGHDSVTGGSGNDILIGNAGNDSLYGEGGNDQFYAADSVYDLLVGGSGTGDEIMNWDSAIDDDLEIELYP